MKLDRILIWNCEPDLPRGEEEVRKLMALNGNDRYEFIQLPSLDWDELRAVANAFNPTVFHFIGHGESDGTLHVQGSDFRIRAADVVRAVQRNSPKLRGVYLSACFSAVDTPGILDALAPAGGWLIGTGAAVDDEQAELFAERFYGHFVKDGMTEREAYDNAYDHVAAIWTYDDMTHSAWLGHSNLPRINDMVQQVHTSIRAIFSRSALQFPMRDEASIGGLEEALDDVALALSTGQVRDRRSGQWLDSISIPPEYLHGAEVEEFALVARKKLQRSRDALARVKAGALSDRPVDTNRFDFDLTIATEHEWMQRINEVDRTRNGILRAADKLFARAGISPLPKIPMSYSPHELASARRA